MTIRFNLDGCGIRISLTAWVMLSRTEREELVAMSCRSDAERAAFRLRLANMLSPHAGNPDAAIEYVEIDAHPIWQELQAVPQSVIDTLNELSLPLLTLPQWKSLNDLQRFAMIKLTRSGHKNANLLPALKEFGLA